MAQTLVERECHVQPMYSKEVMEHSLHPRHVGTIGNADGFGKAGGGPRCPDDLAHFWIRVTDGRIAEVRHKTLGCPMAIGASSMTSVMAQGQRPCRSHRR